MPYPLWVNIARLSLFLQITDNSLNLSLPAGHPTFTENGSSEEHGTHALSSAELRLFIQTGDTRMPSRDEQLVYTSKTWEFWKHQDGRMVFLSLSQHPICKLTIDPTFTNGEVDVDSSTPANKPFYPLEYLEIRLFSAWLATFGDLILHASAIVLDGKGYCFIGESGAGKSTLARELLNRHGAVVLGEDQVILRFLEGRYWIFGTPWHLDSGMCSPIGVPVDQMIFLDRSLPPGRKPLPTIEGTERILQTGFIPYYFNETIPLILENLSRFARLVPFSTLSYRLGEDPWFLIR